MSRHSKILITTFGGLSILSEDLVVDKFASRKARTMFSRLALANKPILRSSMSEMLWPGEFPDTTLERLRTETHRLRSVGSPIREILLTTREHFDLDRSCIDVDLHNFERLLRRSANSDSVEERLSFLQQALASADGEWLPRESDDWFNSERQRINLLRGNAYIAASEAAQELHEGGLTLTYAQDCVRLLPYYSTGVERLVDVLQTLGKVSEAMLVYEAHAAVLHNRFSGTPDPRLQKRMANIHAANQKALHVHSIPESPLDLPVLPGRTLIYGRLTETERLSDWLSPNSDAKRLVSVIGPAGMGKTTVAIETGRRLLAAYENRVVFVDLTAVSDNHKLLEVIAETMHVDGGNEPLPRLRKGFAATPMLLILDNLEQIPDAAVAVDKLLEFLPKVRILATSRRPIRSIREQRLTLSPLLAEDDAGGSDQPGVPLFLEHFRLRVSDYTPDDDAMQAIVALVKKLNGHPLAIVLAASRGQVLSPEEMLNEVDQGIEWIRTDATLKKAEHRELAAAFTATITHLGRNARSHFQMLCLFDGDWTLSSAKELCGEGVLDSLAELLDFALVRRVDVGGGSRYSIATVFRGFILQQEPQSGEADREKLLRWFLGVLRSARASLPKNLSPYIQKLEGPIQCFDSVFQWAAVNSPGDATEILATLCRYWQDTGRSHRYVNLVDNWFIGEPPGEPIWVARGLDGLARLLQQVGRLQDAMNTAERARKLFLDLGDAKGELSTLRIRVLVAYSQFSYRETLELADATLERAAQTNDEATLIPLKLIRALALANLGCGEQAVITQWEIITELESAGETVRALRAKRNLASVLVSLRRWSEAEELLWAVDEEFKTLGLGHDRALTVLHLITTALRTGNIPEARLRMSTVNDLAGPIQADYFSGVRTYLATLLAVKEGQATQALDRALLVLKSWYRPQAELGVLAAVDLIAYALAAFGDPSGACLLFEGAKQARIRNGVEESPHFTCTQEDIEALLVSVSRDTVPEQFDNILELVERARSLAKAAQTRNLVHGPSEVAQRG